MEANAGSGSMPPAQSPQQDNKGFDFRHEWFSVTRHEWEELTAPIRGKKIRALEVGCFEGASTTWMLDNLMSHPESRLTSIDHFCGGMDHLNQPTESYDPFDVIEARFHSNLSKCAEVSKHRLIKASSDDGLLALRTEGARFDFIYIDGSHVALDVLHDAVLCWRMLEEGGTLVFDDLSWKGYNEECYNPLPAIAGFLKCAAPELQFKATETQVWIKKVANHIPATRNPDPDLVYPSEVVKKSVEI